MSNKVKFSYDESERKLRIKDGDEVHVYMMKKCEDEIFLYILKAIDLLDNEGGTGTVTPETVFPGSSMVEDPEAEEDITIFVGGEP